jgi:hypothetical protein
MLHAADNWIVYPLEILIVVFILYRILTARAGKQLYIRKIPGLDALDEAIGRATEMGRPIHYNPGLSGLGPVTLQSLSILSYIIKLGAKFNCRVILTTPDALIYTIAEEVMRESYEDAGKPELFRSDDIRFLSGDQFAFAAGVVGLISRERCGAQFLFGDYAAEALILAEAGHQIGAIQIAGTPSITQIPFFIAACDYTIIGDEYYAASAYISREPTLLGSLVGQDYGKIAVASMLALGIVCSTLYHHWGPARYFVELFRTTQ